VVKVQVRNGFLLNSEISAALLGNCSFSDVLAYTYSEKSFEILLTPVFNGQPSWLKKDGHPVAFVKNGQPAATALSLRVQPPPFLR